MIMCWAVGFVAYQWILPTGPAWWTHWVYDNVAQAGRLAWLGASLPSFALTFVIASLANLAQQTIADKNTALPVPPT